MLTVEIPSLISPDSTATEEHRSDVAHCKRFCEYWAAHPEFREALPKDPYGVAQAAGLKTDPLSIRRLWELDPEHPAYQAEPSLTLLRYRSFMAEKLAFRDTMQTQVKSPHRGYRAWRERQIRRCYGELGKAKGEGLVHAGLAVELCEGCSVGCWFCGISALKFNGVWPYSDENARLWREVLDSLHEQIGDAAGAGFCYWATDPLDNPDYEKFCGDFADRFNTYPQTTTAQPMRDPDRFRELHATARRRGCRIDRFSVLSRGTLRKIFAEYTAEELLFVELVMEMDGAWAGKAFAGKARNKPDKWKKSTGQELPLDAATSTIACVSGILLRMPEQTFELITPCRADEKNPNGYKILARHEFADAEEFDTRLRETLSSLKERLPMDQVVRLRDDLRLETLENGFAVVSDYIRHTFTDQLFPGVLSLAPSLAKGEGTAMQLALDLESSVPLQDTLAFLHRLFALGLLEETY